MSDNILLKLENINKVFLVDNEELHVLKDIQIEVPRGKILCILGYSGCGKTTLMRIMAALENPNSGVVWIEGQEYQKPSKEVLLLFQNFNQLFLWKTIRSNIIHALMITKTVTTKEQAGNLADIALEEVGLYEFRNCYPQQLSGGMKQRAAVARAITLKPKILLMDEPFASLDMVTRHQLQKLIREKCLKYGITVVFVTHGVEEAVLIGDKIIIMRANPGRIGMVLDNSYLISKNSVEKMRIMSIIMEQLNQQFEQEID